MPLPPEDLFAIHELYARYNHAVDFGEPDAWAATFTPNGTFGTNTMAPIAGVEQLRALGAVLAERLDSRHWNSNLIIEPAPGGATGRCYLLLLRPGAPGTPAVAAATGIYRDELEKTPAGWRFKSRYATLEGDPPMKS